MKRFLTCAALVSALALGAGSVLAQAPGAGAPKVAAPALSDAAKAALKAAFPKATMGTFSMYGRGSNRLPSVAMTEGDNKFTVHVTETGVIVRVIAPVTDLSTLPKPVKDAVETASAGAKITGASKVEQRAARADVNSPFVALQKPKTNYELRFVPKEEAPQYDGSRR